MLPPKWVYSPRWNQINPKHTVVRHSGLEEVYSFGSNKDVVILVNYWLLSRWLRYWQHLGPYWSLFLIGEEKSLFHFKVQCFVDPPLAVNVLLQRTGRSETAAYHSCKSCSLVEYAEKRLQALSHCMFCGRPVFVALKAMTLFPSKKLSPFFIGNM